MKKGEITAFLSLVFLLMISFIGAMIESASIQVLKNQKRADMSLAMESIFAEYQKEMLEEYDIFALDGSYETGRFDNQNMMRRLVYYGADRIENNVEYSELLTDNGGRAFYEQAICYVENKLGLDYLKDEKEKEKFDLWKEQEKNSQEYQEEEASIKGGLEDILGESEEKLPEENNPIQSVENLKKSNLLQLVVSNPEQLSNKKVEREKLASFRELRRGTGNLVIGDGGKTDLLRPQLRPQLEKSLFIAYLEEHFSSMTDGEEDNALSYELEYLLGGEMSDRENLECVVKKILSLRFVVNYGYLLTDETKKGEAELMALALCSLLTVPGIMEVVKYAILLAWAYGESILDLRVLMGGKKVPFIKNAENWQMQISGLLTLGHEEVWQEGSGSEDGVSYEDYLKGLLILEKREVLPMRAIDLIECHLQIKADDCVTKLEVRSDCDIRRGIHYEFFTYFGYQ